jgi:hypothetical protein
MNAILNDGFVLELHEDVFDVYFKPYRHPQATSNCWGNIGLQTFGRDFEIVCEIDRSYLWTVVDGFDSDDQWISPGCHLVNRIVHLTTAVPHNFLNVEFRVSRRNLGLTALGLKRQMSRLEKFVASQAKRTH